MVCWWLRNNILQPLCSLPYDQLTIYTDALLPFTALKGQWKVVPVLPTARSELACCSTTGVSELHPVRRVETSTGSGRLTVRAPVVPSQKLFGLGPNHLKYDWSPNGLLWTVSVKIESFELKTRG